MAWILTLSPFPSEGKASCFPMSQTQLSPVGVCTEELRWACVHARVNTACYGVLEDTRRKVVKVSLPSGPWCRA